MHAVLHVTYWIHHNMWRTFRLSASLLVLLGAPSPVDCAPPTNVSHSDELCSSATAPDRKPWIAVVLCGNFRTFTDPRVYKSIRANLVDAFGGNVVTFVFGKLDGEQKPSGLRGGAVRASDQEMDASEARVREAIEYLQEGGRIVEARIARKTPQDIIKADCPMYRNSRTTNVWLEGTYVGQLQSMHSAFHMVEAYEAKHGIRFGWVAKARLDAMWLRGVAPWCTYRPGTAYVISPAPADWFMLLPRTVAEAVMVNPLENYHQCAKVKDAAPMTSASAECCGGGPTALMMGQIMRLRAPLVGPPYTGSKWGPAPGGSLVQPHMMWHTLVMRTATRQQDRDWCNSIFTYGKEQPYYPSVAACMQMLEAPEMRPKLNLALPRTR